MIKLPKNDQHLPQTKSFTFWLIMKKLQMQLVLLIILEPTKFVFAETPESYVDVGGKINDLLAGPASTI